MANGKIRLKNAIAIGIGGMVGGGIFAVLGLAVSLAKGGTPVAFLLAGIIALHIHIRNSPWFIQIVEVRCDL